MESGDAYSGVGGNGGDVGLDIWGCAYTDDVDDGGNVVRGDANDDDMEDGGYFANGDGDGDHHQ